MYGFRDPWGVRPLCIGTYGDRGYMIASESCALATVGAHYLREIEAGEVVCIDARGMRTEHTEVVKPASLCMFEYIYFARPDSVLSGRSIYMARYEMGRALAREHPVDADVVMAVPDSAIPGGIGYAAESGMPYVEGLIKNRYIGRTFISPDQKMRSQGVQLKFNPIVENLRGQRVVVVDDSIVRGTTTPRIVSLLRDAGAREVHLRITSPPIVHPCYLGVDMATYAELIAANLTVPQICERVGADSLGYLSIENLVDSTGRDRGDFCLGCLNGRYPSRPGFIATATSRPTGSPRSKPEPRGSRRAAFAAEYRTMTHAGLPAFARQVHFIEDRVTALERAVDACSPPPAPAGWPPTRRTPKASSRSARRPATCRSARWTRSTRTTRRWSRSRRPRRAGRARGSVLAGALVLPFVAAGRIAG